MGLFRFYLCFFILFFVCANPAHAITDQEALLYSPVASLPSAPDPGASRVIVDGLTENDCTAGGGNKRVLCVYSETEGWKTPSTGASAEADTLQTVFARGKTITGANSRANFMCVGGGVNPLCFGEDSTLGPMMRPQTDVDSRTYIWPGFNWNLYDLGNTKSMVIAEPDALATGSGTVEFQTSEQLVVSNLGVEFRESDTNPSCASGNYNIYADTSETKLKKCVNGTVSDLDTNTTPPTDPTGDAYKAANETVNNSSTFQNDDDLVVPVDANSTYKVEYHLNYEATTTADMKFQYTVPSGATGRRMAHFIGTGVTSCNSSGQTFYGAGLTTAWSAGGIGAGSSCDVVISMIVTTAGTAGNVTLQWAQDVAEVSDAIIRAGSWVTWRKLN